MARVWIPSLLRDLTAGQEMIELPGTKVRHVLDELECRCPGIRDRLCEGDSLKTGMAVIVDGQVSALGLSQPLGPDSEVHFLPALSGG